ncbi:hypothetical protein E4633_15635, partial [Geomonas terrae]
MFRFDRVIYFLIILFSLFFLAEEGFAFKQLDGCGVWLDADIPISYVIDTNAFSNDEAAAIERAFNRWGSIPGSSLRFKREIYNGQKLVDDPFSYPIPNFHLITKASVTDVPDKYKDILYKSGGAATYLTYARTIENGRIFSGSIIFRTRPTADTNWSTSYSLTDTAYMDLESAALHEIGHFIGLAHPDGSFWEWLGGYVKYAEEAQTILGNIPKGTTVRKLYVDDILAAQTLYPAPSPVISQNEESGVAGNVTFIQSGSGFTPNGFATLHFCKIGTTVETTQYMAIDTTGCFSIAYLVPESEEAGSYEWWAVDNSTGKVSNHLSYTILTTHDSSIDQKFQQAYQSEMGTPQGIHQWEGYWVQNYIDTSGFESIMIYNPNKDKVYWVHGQIWSTVYKPYGGILQFGLPTSNEYSYPVSDSLNNVRQDFERFFVTHKPNSDPWWQPYPISLSTSVNPIIAQTDTGMYPPTFSLGQTFRQWGTDFTPNGYATLHFMMPDGSEYPTMVQRLDSIGHFDISYTPPLDKPSGKYTWWAVDNSTGKQSLPISYYIGSTTAPTRTITLVSPNGGQTLYEGSKNNAMYWQTTGNVEKVKVQLYRKDTKILTLTDTFDGGSVLNDGNFFWDISGIDDYSESYRIKLIACDLAGTCDYNVYDYSDFYFTIVRKAPSKVTGLNIPNSAVNQPINSNISWSKVSDATSYNVYFGPSLVYQGNQTSTTFDPGTLQYNTTYYWRVDSRNEGGVTTGSTWSFTTEKAPQLSVSTTDLDFGMGEAGTPTTTTTFTIKNSGGSVLSGYVNKSAGWFDFSTQTYFSLRSGEQQTIVVSGNFPIPPGWFETNISITSNGGNSQVRVHGLSEVYIKWSLANSPYTVTQNTLFGVGYRLIIEPGVVVKFDKDRVLQINGTLVARGTFAQPIIFTSGQTSPAAGDWGRIYFDATSTAAVFDPTGNYLNGSIIEHSIVEYGAGPDGIVYLNQASPYISRSVIRNSLASGVFSSNAAKAVVRDSELYGNGGCGITGFSFGSAVMNVSGNVIRNNQCGISLGNGVVNNNIIAGNSIGVTA